MIGNLQLLRAYAAFAVVIYHMGFKFGLPYGTDFLGVCIFFVISGFLMSSFAHEPPGAFLLKRLTRIAPLYWIGTLLMVYLFGGWAWHDWRDVALSLAFVPHLSAQGNWQPTLGVGWTLVLEMGFYCLFAAFIGLFRHRAPIACAAALVSAVLTVHLSEIQGVWAAYIGHVYNLHFVAGIFLFYVVERVSMRRRLPEAARWLILPVVTSSALVAYLAHLSGDGLVSTAINYVTPFLVVLTAVTLARAGADVRHPLIMALGSASYGVYIFHTIGLEWLRQKGLPVANHPALVPLFLVLLALFAWGMYWLVEHPIQRAVRRHLSGNRKSEANATACAVSAAP